MAGNVHSRLLYSLLVSIMMVLYGCGDSGVNPAELQFKEIEPGLVFSEVYLYNDHPESNWLEVYNASDSAMTLTALHLSNVTVLNVLSEEQVSSGDLLIEPDHALILCADEDWFKSNWGDEFQLVEVDKLLTITATVNGGFIFLGTGVWGNLDIDGFQYGTNPQVTEEQAELFGAQVLSYLRNGNSWSRTIMKSIEKVEVTLYYQTAPSPGIVIKQ
ncbi:hypothetical protein ACFL6I_06150 [candidate division KSB1 bacterium]